MSKGREVLREGGIRAQKEIGRSLTRVDGCEGHSEPEDRQRIVLSAPHPVSNTAFLSK
jgi:hypothetical protein